MGIKELLGAYRQEIPENLTEEELRELEDSLIGLKMEEATKNVLIK